MTEEPAGTLVRTPRSGERAVLVRLGLGAPVDPEDLQEFTQLALSAGAEPVATITGRRERPDPRFFMGSGKADEVRDGAASGERRRRSWWITRSRPARSAISRRLTGRRVLDRNGLILDIFAQRARSFEGKLEVELAQLKHIATPPGARVDPPRAPGGRHRPARPRRNPARDRPPADRPAREGAHQRLEKIKQQRETGRAAARRDSRAVASRWSATRTPASRRCFARSRARMPTSPTSCSRRSIPPCGASRLPGGTPVVVADTVGFIRELPHELVAAFQSTLTEAREATLLLHVVDAERPAARRAHRAGGRRARGDRRGCDSADPGLQQDGPARDARPRIDAGRGTAVRRVWISAANGAGLDLLRGRDRRRPSAVRDAPRRRAAADAGPAARAALRAPARCAARALPDGDTRLLVECLAPELEALVPRSRTSNSTCRPIRLVRPAPATYEFEPTAASSRCADPR